VDGADGYSEGEEQHTARILIGTGTVAATDVEMTTSSRLSSMMSTT